MDCVEAFFPAEVLHGYDPHDSPVIGFCYNVCSVDGRCISACLRGSEYGGPQHVGIVQVDGVGRTRSVPRTVRRRCEVSVADRRGRAVFPADCRVDAVLRAFLWYNTTGSRSSRGGISCGKTCHLFTGQWPTYI